MNKILFLFLVLFISASGFSQKKELKKAVNELETFMNAHIPSGASNVEGYKLRANGCDLDKETFIKGDHVEHHKVYDLREAAITIEHFAVGDESGEAAVLHSEYWNVNIADKWILSGFTDQIDAQTMMLLLIAIQEVCTNN